MKLQFLTPAYRGLEGCHPEFIKSRDAVMGVEAQEAFKAAGITGIDFCYLPKVSALPIARCLLTAVALAKGAEITFWVDDDIAWRWQDVLMAIKSGLPIVGFPCLHKPDETGQPGTTLNYDVLGDEPICDPDKDWRQVQMIGTGAMLVRSYVYETMKKRRPHFIKIDFEHQLKELDIRSHTYDFFPSQVRDVRGFSCYVGEDVGFCMEADAAGFPVIMYCRSVTTHYRAITPEFPDNCGSYCNYLWVREAVREGRLNYTLPAHPSRVAVE